ncbi:MAG: glycosyltransferase, partial [Planctomycetota bacterium]
MSDPRHLLHVFPTFCAAGAQVRTVTLMRAFGDRFRHSVVACDGVTDAAAIADGVALELVPWEPRSGPMSGVRTAAELLRRLQPDLLCTYNWGSMDAVLAARAGGFARHVHHEDGFNADEADGLKARRNWTRRVSLRRTDMVVPSTKLETIARGTWRLPRVHLVPNGVDADRYARDAEAGARFRIERGIPADAFAVGVVGHLRPIKRFDRFLRAFAGAPWPNDVKPHALVVGDGGERAALEALAGSLDVGVTFTGHIEDLAGAYSAMDVF